MKIIRNRLSVLCALAFAPVLPNALAADLTITSDVTNWEGLTLPGSGEEIIINDGVTATVTTRAALDAICGCSRIRPKSETSRFVVEVPEGEVWTNRCPMSAVKLSGAGNEDFKKGELCKKGKGTLFLVAKNHLNVGKTLYDWWTGLTSMSGWLRLPPTDTDGTHYTGYVAVSNGATVSVVENTSLYVRGIFGAGCITNCGSATRQLTIMNEKGINRVSDFGGVIGGRITLTNYKSGDIVLRGTDSTYSGNTSLMNARTTVMKFGGATEASSLGVGINILLDSDTDKPPQDVTLAYGGAGETVGKNLLIMQHAVRRAILDGGAKGGLRWEGKVSSKGANAAPTAMREFVLTGSAATTNVLAGTLCDNYTSADGISGGLYLAKEGAGVWRFSDNYSLRSSTTDLGFTSGIAVRDGVLAYDSLQDKGRLCSLGVSTNLTSGGGSLPLSAVDYAFTLGSDSSAEVPVFEFTGTRGFACATRPLVLAGTGGRFRNDTARRIRFAGVSSLAGSDVKTLTLDGQGSNTNEIADISDGSGRTGVTKEGAGTWCLSGDLTFTGPLNVKAGTLIVRKMLPGVYKWFRWTIMDKAKKTTAYEADVNVNTFGLFDVEGTYQCRGLKLNDSVSELKAGEFGFQTVCDRTDTLTYNPENMFVPGKNYGMWSSFTAPEASAAEAQQIDKPSMWLPIVMRLPDSAKEIATFDFMNTWNTSQAGRCVKISSLEGSVDGLHWNMLTNGLEVAARSTSWTWSISGETVDVRTTGQTGGAPVSGSTAQTYSVLTGEPVVSVATNAALVADGEMSIKHLSVNAAEGLGEINGFAFADGGTIDFTNLSRETKFVKANFKNATDLAKVNDWSVSVNGKAKSGYKVRASEDGIKIVRRGLMVYVR